MPKLAKTTAYLAMHHAFATVVVVAATLAFVVVAYFGLLAWAVLAGSQIGGPLALPFAMLAALVLGGGASLVVFLPVTLLADILCRRVLAWPRAIQIPIATVLCLGYVLAAAALYAFVLGDSPDSALTRGLVVWLILLPPLGAYWWALQASAGLQWVVQRCVTRIRTCIASTQERWAG